MDREEQRKKAEELDRFWEIDTLIPPKRAPHYAADTETTEIELDPPSSQQPKAEQEPLKPRTVAIPPSDERPKTHYIPPHTADEIRRQLQPDEEYIPDNALIRRVRLYRWKSNYRYYEGFARDAAKLYPVTGVECPRVPFFSYVPQYTQMSRAQLEWYLWWRENFRRDVYLDTDYSYVLLYVYEVINLSGRTDPARDQELLCKLWVNYRASYRQLDSYLPEWICDYSLIHRLKPPAMIKGELLGAIMSHCTLKEFYVPVDGTDAYIHALLSFCSNYDYKKSKFYTDERAKLFDRAMAVALRAVAKHTGKNGKLFNLTEMDDSKLARDAYSGALCSYRIKRRIEVDFCSFSRSHELRYFLTDVIKYTENRVRSYCAIRSRLSIYALSAEVRQLLDGALDELLPTQTARAAAKKKAEDEAVGAYEKLYDLPQKALSLTDAAEIERLSWDTTERLVEAFEEEAPTAETESVPASPTMPLQTETETGEDDSPWTPYLDLLRAVRNDDGAGQRSAAREMEKPLDVLADEINALAADLLGDILLEENGDVFAVIEDYREMLEALTDGV